VQVDLETYQFSKLDPKVKRALLEMAPIFEKYINEK